MTHQQRVSAVTFSQIPTFKEGAVEATAIGSNGEAWQVTITENGKGKGSCNCPVMDPDKQDKPICKHVDAVRQWMGQNEVEVAE